MRVSLPVVCIDLLLTSAAQSLHRATAVEVGEKMTSYFTVQAPESANFASFKSLFKKSTADVFVMQYRTEEDSTTLILEGEVRFPCLHM